MPYNPIVHIHDISVVDYDNYLCEDYLAKIRVHQITAKPYLRPLSSMTKEERENLASEFDFHIKLSGWSGDNKIVNLRPYGMGNCLSKTVDNLKIAEVLNWLNAHYFDYRGLIEKGLAIEVTKENNPYKNN